MNHHTLADAKEFVEDNFYVDDELTSVVNSEEAISLLRKIQTKIRPNKITSNNIDVLSPFSL